MLLGACTRRSVGQLQGGRDTDWLDNGAPSDAVWQILKRDFCERGQSGNVRSGANECRLEDSLCFVKSFGCVYCHAMTAVFAAPETLDSEIGGCNAIPQRDGSLSGTKIGLWGESGGWWVVCGKPLSIMLVGLPAKF